MSYDQSLAKVIGFFSFLVVVQADEDQHQLNNNLKIYKLETFASDWS